MSGSRLGASEQDLSSLGLLQELGFDREFQFLRQHRRQQILDLLTVDWPIIQGGYGTPALMRWKWAMEVLELDTQAITDLLLLIHQGDPGRSEANEILWELLYTFGLSGDLHDLSRKASSMVRTARRWIDRPPANSPDKAFWTWSVLVTPRNSAFSPGIVPENPVIQKRQDGSPIRPPHCWGIVPKSESGPPAASSGSSGSAGPSRTTGPPEAKMPGSSTDQWKGGSRPAWWRRDSGSS